jgi:hypothetical protein
MAKYLSKGLFRNDSTLGTEKSFPVRSWLVCSLRLRRIIDVLSSPSKAVGEYLYDATADSKNDFLYVRNHRVTGAAGFSFVCCTFGVFRSFRPFVPRFGSVEYQELEDRVS